MVTQHRMDWQRKARTGTAEAVYCAGKSTDQLRAILAEARSKRKHLLFTRMSVEQHNSLAADAPEDYEALGQTAILGKVDAAQPGIGIVAAGTSDLPVATEAARTLAFHGYDAPIVADVGVAGLWRLTEQLDSLVAHRVLIVVAGMEGALFSVLAGLVAAPIIAVPAPQGYGVAADGRLALDAALGSCAPGLVVVNIGNGFGAACAAIRIMRMGVGQ